MTRIVPVAVLLTLAATCLAFGQEAAVMNTKGSHSNSTVEQEIQQFHREYGHAQLTNDIAMLERIWADDHIFINTFGVVQTKAERLADAKSGTRKIDSFHLDDVQVRVYGNTAVVTSHATIKMQLRGQELSFQARGIDVYVKKNGRWQVVAAQATRIAQP
jgi:ketosteroid isomerase-like protein